MCGFGVEGWKCGVWSGEEICEEMGVAGDMERRPDRSRAWHGARESVTQNLTETSFVQAIISTASSRENGSEKTSCVVSTNQKASCERDGSASPKFEFTTADHSVWRCF